MDRKALARETLTIMDNGYYEIQGKRVDIRALQEYSVKNSFLLTPKEGEGLLKTKEEGFSDRDTSAFLQQRKENYSAENNLVENISAENIQGKHRTEIHWLVWNCSTVEAILRLHYEGKKASVLNFASAKNPGGGFINGANAQEESLAVSSGLYRTLTVHEAYYSSNRAYQSMMYTNHAIYSPDVVFFRDEKFQLMEKPVTASVLTMPAVNMGQVVLKGEDIEKAKTVMRERMKLVLAIFAKQNCRHLVLGAYGCGVFRNDSADIAQWWKELLREDFAGKFETVVFAVLDRSSNQKFIRPFEERFGKIMGGFEEEFGENQ